MTTAHLEALGWTVITIWECELRGKEAAVQTRIDTLAWEIRQAGQMKKQGQTQRRLARLSARQERMLIVQRQNDLEAEINKVYQIPQKIKTASKEIE